MRRFKKYIAELHRVFRREPLRFFSTKLNLLRAPLRYVLFITALLFFASLTTIHAQILDTLKRDSLLLTLKKYELSKKELRQADIIPADTQKANLLWEISYCDDYINNRNAIVDRAKELKNISEKLNYPKGIIKSYFLEGFLSGVDLGNVKAIDFYKKALTLSEKINDAWGVRWACYQIGIFQNANKDATTWHYKAIKLAEIAKDSFLLSSAYSSRGLSGIYSYMGNSNEAVACAEKSIAYCPEWLKNKEYYANALTYLAYFLVTDNQYHKADSIFDIAWLNISQNNLVSVLTTYYNGRSELESKRGNHGKAIQMLLKSNDIIDSLKLNGFGLEVYNNLTIAQYILEANKHQLAIASIKESEKYDEAIKYSSQSLKGAIPLNFQDAIMESYKYLSAAYEGKGNMKQAYKYFKISTEIKDSLYNAENTKTIQGLKMQYETEKKEQEIILLKKDNLLQQEEVSRQQTTRNAFIGGFAMVALISGVAYNRFRLKKNANRLMAVNLERLKHTQQQLVEQEKMASLGTLTAGIAHEIKNPLNFINNFSELNNEIVEDLPSAKNEEEKNKMLNYLKINFTKITEHGLRADSIVNNMLAHSNNEVREKELTDVNEMCDEYFRISYKAMRVTHPDFKCELKTTLDAQLPKITIMAQDVSRVLINIFTNAFYAVNEHKQINPDVKPEVSLITQFQNNSITIFIKDNGTGMSDATREKIFEPFYTTKPAGQGTGLGLSLSFDIIKAHNGKIEVESKENQYTQFKITLPT